MKAKHHESMDKTPSHSGHYKKLLLMTILSYISMYMLMYSMVDTWENVVPNINQFYMAGVMTAPMVLIELALMGGMYENKKLNAGLMLLSAVLLVGFYLGIRDQTGVTDKQFLKSMIPHHAGAILMSKKITLQDADLKELQENIISSQQAEIDFMKRKLKELER
ncbi:MAG: DUF305 domain-containing protein [Daejeonella sp.]